MLELYSLCVRSFFWPQLSLVAQSLTSKTFWQSAASCLYCKFQLLATSSSELVILESHSSTRLPHLSQLHLKQTHLSQLEDGKPLTVLSRCFVLTPEAHEMCPHLCCRNGLCHSSYRLVRNVCRHFSSKVASFHTIVRERSTCTKHFCA